MDVDSKGGRAARLGGVGEGEMGGGTRPELSAHQSQRSEEWRRHKDSRGEEDGKEKVSLQRGLPTEALGRRIWNCAPDREWEQISGKTAPNCVLTFKKGED